jgi:hypothetical protein
MPLSKLSHDRMRRKKQRLRYICLILVFYYQRSLLGNLIRTSIRTGKIFTYEILIAHPRRVLDLRDWMSQNTNLRATRSVSLEERFICFLWIIGHNSSNIEAQE